MKSLSYLTLTLVALFFSGCASSVPTATFSRELKAADRIAKGDTTKVTVVAKAGLDMLDVEKARFTQRIEAALAEKQALNPSHDPLRNYSVSVNVTKYDKGNAFARSMLAGLGQIHIDATVQVFTEPNHELVAEFDLKKTFAWGGIYGGVTTIEDIEKTFARGVASSLTGQNDKEPEKK